MGSCCAVDRSPSEADGIGYNGGYNSVLFHQDTSSTTVNYSLVYRPPSRNGRLIPGEARPRFWISPYDPSKEAAVVSVAWGEMPNCVSQYPCVTRHRNSSRPPKHRACANSCMSNVRLESKGMSEITASKTTLDCGDNNNLHIKTYPDFIIPYVNKVIRLYLVCSDTKISQMVGAYCHLKPGKHTDPSAELSHLIRNMRWLNIHFTYSFAVSGLPQVNVEEHHGGVKRLRKIRYRPMPVSWIDMDHRKPAIKVIGDSFQLTVNPPSQHLKSDDFPEGNGELPAAVGLYVRNLDTAPDTKIYFGARLYNRYNIQTLPDVQTPPNITNYVAETQRTALDEIL